MEGCLRIYASVFRGEYRIAVLLVLLHELINDIATMGNC